MRLINFDKLPYAYWSYKTKISFLQRRVIVYSIMYYHFDGSCITDREYDLVSKQLVEMQNSVELEVLKETEYYYAMYDFDGTTGFDLSGRLTKRDREYLFGIAEFVLKVWKSDGNG